LPDDLPLQLNSPISDINGLISSAAAGPAVILNGLSVVVVLLVEGSGNVGNILFRFFFIPVRDLMGGTTPEWSRMKSS
jgi:hypothetical protein